MRTKRAPLRIRDTHVNAFGDDTHKRIWYAFGVWEGQRLTHMQTHLGLDEMMHKTIRGEGEPMPGATAQGWRGTE